MGSIWEPLEALKDWPRVRFFYCSRYFVSFSTACAPPRTTISFLHSCIQDISQPSEHSRQTKTELPFPSTQSQSLKSENLDSHDSPQLQAKQESAGPHTKPS